MIVSQEPQLPRDNMFHIGDSTGQITLLDDSLNAETAKKYTLEVLAADLGGAAGGKWHKIQQHTTCFKVYRCSIDLHSLVLYTVHIM